MTRSASCRGRTVNPLLVQGSRAGFEQIFGEDVMQRPLGTPTEVAALPRGVTMSEWGPNIREDFFAAYSVSFADRLEIRNRSAQQWISWTSEDNGFRPTCSLLARDAEQTSIGFVTCSIGWLLQLGTVPSWRGRGVARSLIAAAMAWLQAAGDTEVHLCVNVNNPAAALYGSLGFSVLRRRARYERIEQS